MTDVHSDVHFGAESLLAATEPDITVDPASLERLAGDAALSPSSAPVAADALVLSLDDLLPDRDGAVVMLSDDTLPVSLVSDAPLAGRGVVDDPVSAGGHDLEGLFYYSFANGLTLYSDTDIVIVDASLGA